MSADMSGEGEGTPEGHECPEGKIWSEEAGTCIDMTEAGDKTIGPSGVEASTSPNLIQAIVTTVDQHIDKRLAAFTLSIDKKLEDARDKIGGEIQTGLRKSLGLDTDPAVHMSDLAEFGRKLQLETAPSGKRSPASKMAGVGPDGNVKETGETEPAKQITNLFKEYGFTKEATA